MWDDTPLKEFQGCLLSFTFPWVQWEITCVTHTNSLTFIKEHEAKSGCMSESFRKEGKQISTKWARKAVVHPSNLLVHARSISWILGMFRVVTFTRVYYVLILLPSTIYTLFLALTFESSPKSKWHTVTLRLLISITGCLCGRMNRLSHG